MYYIVPGRIFKNLVLIVSSLLFYSWGEPFYVLIMVLSILNDYTFSNLLVKARENNQPRKARVYFIISILINLGLLGFFKYYGFAVDNLNNLFNLNLVNHDLPLPIGISFYTFQTMSYSIDVYRRKVKVQKNILTLATYVALFPQLIAGPIVRYIDVESDMENRIESLPLIYEGTRRFIKGLAKKVLIANTMGFFADFIYNGNILEHGTLILWLAAIAYALQIYFDFSGYSDMAIGLGKMFGFNFPENFNHPYMATSITDFWRRWHISLSTWFRDYLYIPLGGNNGGSLFQIRNLFIVWLATGLWHGASWNFILWGLYYFVFLVLEKFLLADVLKKIPSIIKRIATLLVITVGWVIFRLEDFQAMGTALSRMFVYNPLNTTSFLFDYQPILYTVPFMLAGIFFSFPLYKKMEDKITGPGMRMALDVTLLIVFMVSIMFLAGENYNPFIYYRF